MKIPIFDWIMDSWDESKRERERMMWAEYIKSQKEAKKRREDRKK